MADEPQGLETLAKVKQDKGAMLFFSGKSERGDAIAYLNLDGRWVELEVLRGAEKLKLVIPALPRKDVVERLEDLVNPKNRVPSHHHPT